MRTRSTTRKLKDALAQGESVPESTAKLARRTVEQTKLAPKQVSQHAFSVDITAELGKGTFATVYRGTYENQPVAVKQVEKEPAEGGDFQSRQIVIMTELNQLNAPHIIQLYAYTSLTLPYYLIMPLMRHGSLASHIEDAAPFTASLKYTILVGVAKALAFMHQQLLIHCDIKAENVLLDENNVPFLTDFDSAVRVDPVTHASRGNPDVLRGTLMYVAPEIIEYETYSTSSDMYAFAILTWEVMAWKYAGDELDDLSLLAVWREVLGGYREKIPADWAGDIKALIQNGWHQEPARRPVMQAACEVLERQRAAL